MSAGQSTDVMRDEELLFRIRAGETGLFNLLVHRHRAKLSRMAYRILRDVADAEDAVQDACLAAYERLHQFAGTAKFSTWITRIVISAALLQLRKRQLRSAVCPQYGFGSVSLNSSQTPEELTYCNELVSRIGNALEELPVRYREIVILKDVREFTTKEAAAHLGITIANAKVRGHRAAKLLREKLLITNRDLDRRDRCNGSSK